MIKTALLTFNIYVKIVIKYLILKGKTAVLKNLVLFLDYQLSRIQTYKSSQS